jgi:hypothetical protein
MTNRTTLTPAETANFLERLAELEAKEAEREAAAQTKLPNPNRRTKDLGVKTGPRYCTDQACDFYLVKVPVPLRGQETEVLMKDVYGNIQQDKVESSFIAWDFESPDQAVCEGCRNTVGNLPPDSPPPAAGFDDLTALPRRRIKIGDEDALSIKQDIKQMRDRQAKVLAEVEKANEAVQKAVEEDL